MESGPCGPREGWHFSRSLFSIKLPALLIALWVSGVARSVLAADVASAAQTVFERRILPIFKSPNPSSCTECHLAGVDLKQYILPSHERTFLSLRDQGLVDLENPA